MNTIFQRITLAAIICIFIFNSSIPAFALTPEEDTSAVSAILMDTTRGQVLYEKEADAIYPPLIMCKLMTALLTIEKSQLNSKVTISKNAVSMKGSSLNLVVGNLYSVEDLLYGTMLSQGNDAAMALAEYIGNGNVSEFVGYMNDKAKELNLTDTYFVNPTGLYDDKQFTSTRDIAKLVKNAISNSTFNSLLGAKGIAWINGNDSSILTNQNKLFWSYSGVDGGKIGTTPQQGTTSVTTATRDNRRLIAVVLDKNETNALSQTSRLFDYGFSHFSTGILVPKNTTLRSITVEDVNINLISKIDVTYTYPLGDSFIKNISFSMSEKLKLPINTDTIAGILNYTLSDGTLIDVNLYPDKTAVAPQDYKSRIKSIFKENRDLVTIVSMLIVIEFVIIIYRLFKLLLKIFKRKKSI
ncbi:D-alanyl-D-alanine carboxypeptidase/D-alanyl-D-alanine carboxypeptidase (penicillin-binding protein 5/6) [Ruminiclostridium sufflavum DSM 19573]|uniref:D-alanyl-D-alanine carboxypeptidase/D-alanyl-D-alanine carboxypeptidase (Penicillin-binding protein 5/6) n=1 Tax=Ruminiclostridium sufflavum DSM 19573 TaxID=1121337 RepID=A0A318XNK9_9FIRM|nr:D-alanyl-D-alanine carboxypeptidase family protein [Ruminiclostridium sufflavum]PYG88529.1 D-alanyl-D-alanine carboxypeptidase/D-alanyl-D-alanine carboxypeptidase (penicillin-binding protein 5/6) [Ruminiclostridium sufflavum DSM 19573]